MDVELLAEPKTDVSDMERNSTYLDFSDDSSIELAGFSGNKITIEKNTRCWENFQFPDHS